MKIFLIQPLGFCSGVRRSINLAREIRTKRKEVFTLGFLVHNPRVIEKLSLENIKIWNFEEKPRNKVLLVRAHGLPWERIEEYKKLGNEVFDATCPLVKKVQKLAEFLSKNGYRVIIIGEENHPEVQGILSYTYGKGYVIQKIEDIDNIKNFPKIGVVSQTTQNWEEVKEMINKILDKGKEVRIFKTICPEVEERQKKLNDVSKKVDVMLVLGGKNSANTQRLFQIAKNYTKTYHLENIEEMNKEWFKKEDNVGIISGTSTPDSFIFDVIERLKEWFPLEIFYL
ncbi:MAG: 4-hydroxy-3-methylbut-2-enyl diphosphate reductase [Dictyoglomaceae bacterium]